jgi:hypothetical protein
MIQPVMAKQVEILAISHIRNVAEKLRLFPVGKN